MSCPKRPYKFLGLFKSYKDHDWQIEKVGVFMKYVSDEFTVISKCSHCGLTDKRNFVEAEELMKKGYTLEQLDEFKRNEV